MEKTVEMKGKQFDADCASCPYCLAFNRQSGKGYDKVAVACGSEVCVSATRRAAESEEG